jgi:hypothetical protein
MSTETKKSLLPKLRFPEFLNTQEWKFAKVDALVNTVTPPKKLPTSSYRANGKFPIVDQSQSDICGWTDDHEALINDALPVIVFGDHTCVLKLVTQPFAQGADGIKILKSRSIVGTSYLYQYLNYRPVVTEEYKRHYSILKEKQVLFPDIKTGEQQKIAECLSSLDELMAAQARKVDALKTHKKGLMQQLFPCEGETQPRLRFPEFQDAGEWARKSVQEMIDQQFIVGHLDGNHGELYPKAEEFSQNKEGIPYITANDFINGGVEFSRCKRLPIERARLFKKGVAKDGDILFAHNATVGPVAKLSTSEEFVILSTTATYFRCNAKYLSNDFLKSALSSPDFVAQYSRVMSQSTRNQVPITTQRKLDLHVPKPPEQQRIASCLSNLDALITAESQKLEALKTHKKGLMQPLFPIDEAVGA